MKHRRIIIINSSLSYTHKSKKDIHCFPATAPMLLLTVLHKAGYEVTFLDGNMYDIDDFLKVLESVIDDTVAMAGFSVMTFQVPWAYRVAVRLKEIAPSILSVWGGIHANLFPEQTVADPAVDIVVTNECISDGLLMLANVLSQGGDLSHVPGIYYKDAGGIKMTPRAKLDSFDDIPFINFELMDHRHYGHGNFLWNYYPEHIPKVPNISYPILTGLGCAYRCSFCVNVILRRRYRCRPAEEVTNRIEFIQKEYGANFIQFMDEDFFVNQSRAKRFVDLTDQKKMCFYYRTSLRVDYFRPDYINEDFAKRLFNNGMCIAVLGAESGSQRILDILSKGITVEDIKRAAAILSKTRIVPRMSFMVGIPGETLDDLKQTEQLIDHLRNENPRIDVRVMNYRPYPGSALYQQLVNDGLLNEPRRLRDWDEVNMIKGHGLYSIAESKWIKHPEKVASLINM